MKLGDVLRSLLEERNLSQKELATALSMAPSTLGNYIRNEREADYETLKLLARFFDVSIDYLLDFQCGAVESPKEGELLRLFRALTPDQQDLFIEQGRAIVIHNNKKETSFTSISQKATAK